MCHAGSARAHAPGKKLRVTTVTRRLDNTHSSSQLAERRCGMEGAAIEGVDTLRCVRGRGVLLLGPDALPDRPVLHMAPSPPPAPSLLCAADKYGLLLCATEQGSWRRCTL